MHKDKGLMAAGDKGLTQDEGKGCDLSGNCDTCKPEKLPLPHESAVDPVKPIVVMDEAAGVPTNLMDSAAVFAETTKRAESPPRGQMRDKPRNTTEQRGPFGAANPPREKHDCNCAACFRERRLTDAVARRRLVHQAKQMPMGLSAIDVTAAMASGVTLEQKRIVSQKLTELEEFDGSYVKPTDAVRSLPVPAVHYRPSPIGTEDIAVVNNFLACCESVTAERTANGDDTPEQTRRKIECIGEFQRLFLSPAANSMNSRYFTHDAPANAVDAVFDALMELIRRGR